MDLDERLQLNTRVLRRFDPGISQILGVASFAVLYSFDKGEWTKTGTEGPLFLVQRSEEPYFGMQILNRNDPENFVVGITPDDDIELSNEFIIYRSHQKSDTDDEGICGFWIFEPSQLEQLGKLILSLREGPYPPPPAPAASESIRLDDLFGTEAGAPESTAPPPMFTEEDKAGASILNALFRDAAPAPEASVEAAQDAPAPSDGPAPQSIDLDDLFASTSVSDPADGAPVEKPQSPPPPPPPPAKVPESTDAGLLQLLTPSDTAERLPPTLMDRADFVQHLVTDKAYVDQLYTEYRARHGL